jgi:hypothetical protein
VAAACAVALSALVTQSHARDIGTVGGTGGNEFYAACRPNDVVIGFNMRTGEAINAIVPICIALNPQRTEWTGQAYEANPPGTPGGTYWGGPDGNYQKIACNPGDAVRHFHVLAGPLGNIVVTKEVRMTCQDLNSGHWYDVFPSQLAGSAVNMDQRFSCGADEWGTGIYGRIGSLVDRLGFTCDKIAAANSPLPPPVTEIPPPPQQVCTVTQTTEVYDAPRGTRVPPDLEAGTPGVTRVGTEGNFHHVKWAARDGWVYSGTPPDWVSLNCP